MRRSIQNWSVKQVIAMINKGTITFDNPVQREAGQWNDEKKSLLINSLINMFVPELYAIKSEGKYDIVDGRQRLTNILEYINGDYKLTENTPRVMLSDTTGETYEVAGLKFYELPEEVKDAIYSYMLCIRSIELDESDDEETLVDDIFYRLNSGAPMSKSHLALISSARHIQEFVKSTITEHPLFTNVAHFSNTQLKNSERQMAVLQTIVLASGLEFNSFAARDVEKFMVDNNNSITPELLDKVTMAYDVLADAFNNEHSNFMTKIHISAFANLAITAIEKGMEDQYKEFVQYYVSTTKPGDNYRIYCGAGSVKKDKTNNRVLAITDKFREFLNKLPEVVVAAE